MKGQINLIEEATKKLNKVVETVTINKEGK